MRLSIHQMRLQTKQHEMVTARLQVHLATGGNTQPRNPAHGHDTALVTVLVKFSTIGDRCVGAQQAAIMIVAVPDRHKGRSNRLTRWQSTDIGFTHQQLSGVDLGY